MMTGRYDEIGRRAKSDTPWFFYHAREDILWLLDRIDALQDSEYYKDLQYARVAGKSYKRQRDEANVNLVVVDADDPKLVEQIVSAILTHTNHSGIQCGEGPDGHDPTPLVEVARAVLAVLRDRNR